MDWLEMLFRWMHVIAGIAWIGASFYFVWLDNHLESPPRWKSDKGTTSHDMHATILDLLGVNHEKLTVRHNGIDRRLTDVHGQVIRDIIA